MPSKSSALRRVILSLIGIIGFLALGGVGFQALAAMRPEPKRREDVARTYSVETKIIERQTIREKIVAYGTARALKASRVSSRVSGEVGWMREGLRPGVFVEENEKLLSLDLRPFEAEAKRRRGALEQARAELKRLKASETALANKKQVAERDLQLAQTDYDRALDLIKRNVVSTRERDVKEMAYQSAQRAMIDANQRFEENQAEIDRAEAVVAQGEASLRQAELDIEFAVVEAPFDGIVQSVSVEVGEVVAAAFSAQPLVEVVATGKVEIPVKLPASRLGDIAVGQIAYLTQPGRSDLSWTGEIARVAPRIDETTRTVEIYVLVDNDPSDSQPDLLPGAFVMAKIDGREFRDVLAVSRRAVVDKRAFVVVPAEEGEGWIAEERDVVVGATANGLAIIDSGLNPGEEVVLTNLDVVYGGSPLRPIRRGENNSSLMSPAATPALETSEAPSVGIESAPRSPSADSGS
jgi:RND family efflux transporter MFP subunit